MYEFQFNLMMAVLAMAAPKTLESNTEQKLKLILLLVLIEKYKIHMLFGMERTSAPSYHQQQLASMHWVGECVCVQRPTQTQCVPHVNYILLGGR